MNPVVHIPRWFIQEEFCDYQAELLACMNCSLAVSGLEIKPFTAGILSLLELINGQVWHDINNCSDISWGRCLYIVNNRKKALPAVLQFIQNNRQDGDEKDIDLDLQLDYHAGELLQTHLNAFKHSMAAIRSAFLNQLSVALSGFRMIPSGGGRPSPGNGEFIFGSTYITPQIMTACELLNVSYEEALWDIPISLIGHVSAVNFVRNDIKDRGIARPLDQNDLDVKMKEAEIRVLNGELHPWQITRPLDYPPTMEQIFINPEVQKRYDELINKDKK